MGGNSAFSSLVSDITPPHIHGYNPTHLRDDKLALPGCKRLPHLRHAQQAAQPQGAESGDALRGTDAPLQLVGGAHAAAHTNEIVEYIISGMQQQG